ncbi:PAS domain S-box-containing protein [Haloactinopolyspora alba]|uniref:PAS domain S-box-containing protein n=1 Tax=Haloactinopolyspora alba TaxID=648780 RepID=A0A2P8E2H5_9ACTN|nr:SpoIIE family protein phosphatase [Haloactinopolyspora alba]PSL03671.1 PAS domain S-box-containing protein [Haloactinopolyspora alba]
MRPADAQRLLGALAGVDAPVGFAVFDAEHRYLAVNAALAERSGRSIAEHLGRTPSEVLPDALAAHTDEMIERVLRTGESVEAEEPPVPDAPNAYHLHSSWYLVDEGRGREVAMFVVDDTSHQRAISSLRRSRARNVRLLEVSDVLSRAVAVEEVAEAVEDIGRRSVGALRTGVTLIGQRGPYAVRARPAGDQVQDWPEDAVSPVAEVMRTGWPMFVSGAAHVRDDFPDPRFRAFLDATDERAWAVLPLTVDGEHVGAVRFAFAEEREFDSDVCRFLRAVAQQCSLAFARARLFERERTAAVSLSQGLLPRSLPSVPGVELEARSRSDVGSEMGEDAVGGDWYDAFVLPDGALGLALGDVMGHGVAAAAEMGQMRSALRALALTDPDPAAVLHGLDRLVERDDVIEMLTVVYALVDPSSGVVSVGDAGHLPLIRIPAAGEVELVDVHAGTTPVGVAEPRSSQSVRLSPGDVLIAFTDGLIESRRRSLEDGFTQLLRFLEDQRGAPLGQLLDTVIERMRVDESTDDVTVLALRWAGR